MAESSSLDVGDLSGNMTQKGGGEEVEDICKGLMRSDYNDGARGRGK